MALTQRSNLRWVTESFRWQKVFSLPLLSHHLSCSSTADDTPTLPPVAHLSSQDFLSQQQVTRPPPLPAFPPFFVSSQFYYVPHTGVSVPPVLHTSLSSLPHVSRNWGLVSIQTFSPLLLFHRSQSTPEMIAAVLREIFGISFQFLHCTSELTQGFFLSPPFDLLLISALLPTPSLPLILGASASSSLLDGLEANAAKNLPPLCLRRPFWRLPRLTWSSLIWWRWCKGQEHTSNTAGRKSDGNI